MTKESDSEEMREKADNRSVSLDRVQRRRHTWALWMLAVLGLGLLWRSPALGLDGMASKYGGDALWAAFVFAACRFVFPRLSIAGAIGLALLFSAAVEVSQLYHAPWLDAVRATRLGALALGATFNWPDLLAYGVGVSLAAGVERGACLLRRRRALLLLLSCALADAGASEGARTRAVSEAPVGRGARTPESVSQPKRATESNPRFIRVESDGLQGWRLAPRRVRHRTGASLANYFHMDLPDSRVDHLSERLAQWDTVILNDDLVRRGKVSLTRMRQTNPRVRVLAWVPLQGPNDGLARGVPREGPQDWFGRKADGTYLDPHWGGHLMNPCRQDRAWLRHVLRYVRDVCFRPGGHNGLMFDCLWPAEPEGLDVNEDGVVDRQDTAEWQDAMLFLLREVRAEFPETMVVGNGGVPWPADCPYYESANGCMHENALGDQFGSVEWSRLWSSYRTAISKVSRKPTCHFIQVDVRANRRTQELAASLSALTSDDRRRFRLGLATTMLLDGGYFGFDRGDCLHGQLWWFDEYEVDLGPPLGAVEEGRWGPGLFSREFERGLVLVNPTPKPVLVPRDLGQLNSATVANVETQMLPAQDARVLTRANDGEAPHSDRFSSDLLPQNLH